MQLSKQMSEIQDGANIVQSNSNYGFIIESVQADWLLKNFCQLTLATGDLGQSRHYALAFPKGQLISKCPYEKSVLSKIPTKKFPRFLF